MEKALLYALLMPYDEMKKLQDTGDFSRLMVLGEELKTLPFGDIWDEYCRRSGVPCGMEWFDLIRGYEDRVLKKR